MPVMNGQTVTEEARKWLHDREIGAGLRDQSQRLPIPSQGMPRHARGPVVSAPLWHPATSAVLT